MLCSVGMCATTVGTMLTLCCCVLSAGVPTTAGTIVTLYCCIHLIGMSLQLVRCSPCTAVSSWQVCYYSWYSADIMLLWPVACNLSPLQITLWRILLWCCSSAQEALLYAVEAPCYRTNMWIFIHMQIFIYVWYMCFFYTYVLSSVLLFVKLLYLRCLSRASYFIFALNSEISWISPVRGYSNFCQSTSSHEENIQIYC